jgi:long-chain-fatty-acid--CoA ligase ACSBG
MAYPDYNGTKGPFWTHDYKAENSIKLAQEGCASWKPTTLIEMFKATATTSATMPAFMIERPCPDLVDGKPPPALPIEEWKTWSWADYFSDVQTVAKAYVALGFATFDSVSVWGFNSPEWIISAVAGVFAGGKMAGLYPTDSPEAAAYKVVHSGASVLVLEDRGKLTKIVKGLNDRGDCKRLQAIVVWGFQPAFGENVAITGVGSVPVLSWAGLLEKGKASNVVAGELQKRQDAIKPGNCAALIYTSGTTGDPKAVMVSHDSLTYEGKIIMKLLGDSCGYATSEQERGLSYLPLSHVAGLVVDVIMPMSNNSGTSYSTMFFARPYDLKAGSVKDRLQVAKPTAFLGVPLVWEKIADRIRAIGASTTGVKKSLATWAKDVALTKAKNSQLNGTSEAPWGFWIADKVILTKIKENLGLEKCKYAFTGAAPIRVDTLEYFGSLGMQINEVYGMSECTGATTVSTDQAHVWGSCGWEGPGMEVRAFKVDPSDINKKEEVPRADDTTVTDEAVMGELCYRGRHVMMGYMAQPDLGAAHVNDMKKKNAETIDAEGWLHSGDKGLITKDGMVKITGRYKELIIGAGGENIAPVPIEDAVKKACDGINEVMMVGDHQKYNCALVTLKAIGANGETPGTDDLDAGAKRVNEAVTTISAAMDDDVWIKTVTDAINQANKNPKVCQNNAFTIQKFMILPTNFSEEKNQLTPTKKLKRKIVETQYADAIKKMYDTSGVYIRYSA